MYTVYAYDEIYHAGIKGMKWGIRRYQNPDGTYTDLGKARRREDDGIRADANKPSVVKPPTTRMTQDFKEHIAKTTETKESESEGNTKKWSTAKKAAVAGSVLAAGILATYAYANRDQIADKIEEGKQAFRDMKDNYYLDARPSAFFKADAAVKNAANAVGNTANKIAEPVVDTVKKGVAPIGNAAKSAADYMAPVDKKIKEAPDKFAEGVKTRIKKAPENAAEYIDSKEKELGNRFDKAVGKTIDRAIDASIAAAGIYAVKKISDYTAKNKVDAMIQEMAKQTVSDATKLNNGYNNSDNTNSHGSPTPQNTSLSTKPFAAGIKAVDQAPAKREIDKSSKEYADLFKYSNGQSRNYAQRAAIKQLINEGYSIDQIQAIIYKTENG